MKFINGAWLIEEGFEIYAPKEVFAEKLVNNTLMLTAPTQPINHKGDTLSGLNLTVEISTPYPEVIRVRAYHHKGALEPSTFELQLEDIPLSYSSNAKNITVFSGSLKLVITKKPWSMQYYRNNTLISGSQGRDLGYIRKDSKGLAYDSPNYHNSYMVQNLQLSVGELVYGTGERFTNFIKNGQSVDIWNEDGGTSSYQSYKNIPFYLTNRGYGVFVNNSGRVSFEIGHEQVNKVGFSTQGEELDYFFIDGPSLQEVLERYTAITGRPPLPAPWTYGLWLSTSFTTDYNEETVMSFIDGMLERDIPLQVFHFDCFWMKAFHWSNFLWDTDGFADPQGMLKRIAAKGLKTCVWINPYIAQDSELFDEGMEQGFFLHRPNGQVWQWDLWQPGMAIVDFTNPEACSWFRSKLQLLLDMGVDCFKTDFGERIPTDVVYHNGANPYTMHNYYTHLYNKEVYTLLQQAKGDDQAILFARSATAGGQQFPVHWGGDCWSTYEAMAESLRGGLSLLMSGFAYWSHDIGGFEDTSSPDVYKRWVAFGLLSSHSRLHGSSSYRVPWLYDEEAVSVVRSFTSLKARLMPYIYSYSVEAAEKGVPLMRSMVMAFTEDPTCHYLDRQYMFGASLLVAPIFNSEGLGSYYLPKGRWTNFFTGEIVEGAGWQEAYYDYFSLPLMVQENSLIPLGSTDTEWDYEFDKHMEVRIYELIDQVEKDFVDNKGTKRAFLALQKKGFQVEISYKLAHPCSIRFVNYRLKTAENLPVFYEVHDTVMQLPKGSGTYVAEYCDTQNGG